MPRFGDHVTPHGGQPNRLFLQVMRQAHILPQHSVVDLHTGDREGLPWPSWKRWAQALPVVSTREAGIPEAVLDGVTGFLAEPGDTVGMAVRVLQMARDVGLRGSMGLAGWQRAKDCFTWEKERANLLKIFGLEHWVGEAE